MRNRKEKKKNTIWLMIQEWIFSLKNKHSSLATASPRDKIQFFVNNHNNIMWQWKDDTAEVIKN